MATIRKRKNKWQVVVRRKGFPPVAKTLIKYADAKKFANEIENKIQIRLKSQALIITQKIRTKY